MALIYAPLGCDPVSTEFYDSERSKYVVANSDFMSLPPPTCTGNNKNIILWPKFTFSSS